MQLPTVDRTPSLQPQGADMVAPSAPKVLPVLPVNPPVRVVPSVINNINPDLQAQAIKANEVAQTVKPDPLKGGAQEDTSHKDWTERRPAPGHIQPPPPEPMSKMLMEHVKSLWSASARAVEVWLSNNPGAPQTQTQLQKVVETRNQTPMEVPGVVAKEALTYSPRQIKHPDKL